MQDRSNASVVGGGARGARVAKIRDRIEVARGVGWWLDAPMRRVAFADVVALLVLGVAAAA